MNFYIKKNSTLPVLKYEITKDIINEYSLTHEMIMGCAVTFSMINKENNSFVIANKPGDIVINEDGQNIMNQGKYLLCYKFSELDTKKTGYYHGEFKVDFIYPENCGKLTLPNNENINIFITDSITKTTLV